MALLTRIEEIISIPLELFHQRKGFHPIDLNRMALRCMEKGARKGIRQTYAPNAFTLRLNPSDYEALVPFLSTIRSDVKGELHRVAEERGYQLAGDLAVELVPDKDVAAGKPLVDGVIQGKAEPVSTVLMAEVDRSGSPETDTRGRDEPTVIMLPADEPVPAASVEQGISLLRQGRAKEAADCLTTVDSDAVDTPRFLAAMAVAMELLGNAVQAGRLYQRLQEIDGGRPEVQRRIDYLAEALPGMMEDRPRSWEAGRIELGGTGAYLCVVEGEFQLHNPLRDPGVRVNGRVHHYWRLNESDRVRIGGFEMTYRSAPGEKTRD